MREVYYNLLLLEEEKEKRAKKKKEAVLESLWETRVQWWNQSFSSAPKSSATPSIPVENQTPTVLHIVDTNTQQLYPFVDLPSYWTVQSSGHTAVICRALAEELLDFLERRQNLLQKVVERTTTDSK